MIRLFAGALLSVLATVALASGAGAKAPVLRSGNTFYVPLCGRAVGLAAHCDSFAVTDRTGKQLQSGRPPIAGKTPAQLRDAYKITANGSATTIVAIVDAFGYANAESDLAAYRSEWGLPACTTDNGCFKKLNQKGQQKKYPAENGGWAEESALDLDMASAMCPNCTIYLVEGKTNSFKNLGTAVNTAASLGAHVISNSYGGSEAKGESKFESYYSHPGVAVVASTGDAGYGVQSPAAYPEVIAVGGTHLIADSSSRGWSETVWSGAGSGCSLYMTKPSWQTDSGCSKRTVGDVSAVADPATGVAIYYNGAWRLIGGTSVSSPLIGGIFGANGGAVNAASTIYANPTALFDVTSGHNGTCSPAYLCTGEVGYDGPTGLGTPNGITAFGN
jgi:subtilase family serine protease